MNTKWTLAALVLTGTLSVHAARHPGDKCAVQDATAHSGESCSGVLPIDAASMQGLDETADKKWHGPAIQLAQNNQAAGKVAQPVKGQTAEQRDKVAQRNKLSTEDRRECEALDTQIKSLANPTPRQQVELYKQRKKYEDLKC